MQDVVEVGIHSSVFSQRSSEVISNSLSTRELASSILYRGALSASLWERLHHSYAPSCQETHTPSLHGQGFSAFLECVDGASLNLISLGCGLAEKESQLLGIAGVGIKEVILIDTSVELVAEAKQRCLMSRPDMSINAIAADLSMEKQWRELLPSSLDGIRLFTLFGMVPNFDRKILFRRLSETMKSGDWLLLDANLRPDPISGGPLIPQSIVDQYDNLECRQWLLASLAELGFYESDGTLLFSTEDTPGLPAVPRIRVVFELNREVVTSVGGQEFRFQSGDKLGVFYSMRYCRADLRKLLEPEGIQVVQEWVSHSGEDGLYLCRKP